MEIVINNHLDRLEEILYNKARFQKVMLLYDDTVSNEEISAIYECIKNDCIFNKADINIVDLTELNNGYRLLIFKCSVDSFLNANLDGGEFVNVYMPTDSSCLPYYAKERIDDIKSQHYLMLDKDCIDTQVLPSVYFNRFNECLQSSEDININFEIGNISQDRTIELIESVKERISFFDIEIISECHIPYRLLPIVDYILISAYAVIIDAVKSKTVGLVDTYKSAREDSELIDRYYAMNQNAILLRLIKLNLDNLSLLVKRTRIELLEHINPQDECEIESIIMKIKEYLKHSDSLLSYLYLYGVFGV